MPNDGRILMRCDGCRYHGWCYPHGKRMLCVQCWNDQQIRRNLGKLLVDALILVLIAAVMYAVLTYLR